MYEYRKVFYKDYYASQAGRESDAREKLETDIPMLSREVLPLLNIPKDAKILDIGCGYGSFIAAMKKAGYTNVSGIDISPDQVAVAHKLGIPEVIQADLIPYLQSMPQSFDLISGLDIIEHFSKDELVNLLSLIHNSLKPAGRAIFRTPNLDAPFATVFANGDFTHENYMNAYSARQVMMNSGFSEIAVFPSNMQVKGVAKELLRKLTWGILNVFFKATLFATGRSTKNVLFTPNMLIRVRK
jgi:2-polyprenyl-3-methyl-5-hydroxy-6-metoxy-1,4-benzoquinol methylase